jgi:hypothetical protein
MPAFPSVGPTILGAISVAIAVILSFNMVLADE